MARTCSCVARGAGVRGQDITRRKPAGTAGPWPEVEPTASPPVWRGSAWRNQRSWLLRTTGQPVASPSAVGWDGGGGTPPANSTRSTGGVGWGRAGEAQDASR
jgi:hypothetical protein